MFKSCKDTSGSNKGGISQEFFKSVISFQNEIAKSGVSTWHDHIPQLQDFFTLVMRGLIFNFNANENPEIVRELLEESLKYIEEIEKYLLGKDLKNPVQLWSSLTHLREIILLVSSDSHLLKNLLSERNLMHVKRHDSRDLLYISSKPPINRDKYKGPASLTEVVPISPLSVRESSNDKENFFSGWLKKYICG